MLNTQQNLKENGLDWVAVRAEGRDIILSGVAPTIALHQQAVEIAEEFRGVRVVYDNISPTVITPYSMNISYRDRELVFKGYMPSKESIEILFRYISKKYPTYKIVKQLDVGTGEPKEWESLVMIVSSLLLEKLDLGVVNIVDSKVTFFGKYQTSEQENEILLYLSEYKNIGFDIESHIVAMDEGLQVCQKKFNQLLSTDNIEFEAGEFIVQSRSQALLNGLMDIFSFCPNSKIEIVGHTDSMGDDIANQELSYQRANAVVAKLFQLGIPLDQMEAVGKGEREPIADNNIKEGRAKNRRIEFKLGGE